MNGNLSAIGSNVIRSRCLFLHSLHSFFQLWIAHSPWKLHSQEKMKKIWFAFSAYNTFRLCRSIFSGRKEAELGEGTGRRRLSMSMRLSIDFQAKSHLFPSFFSILHLISILFCFFLSFLVPLMPLMPVTMTQRFYVAPWFPNIQTTDYIHTYKMRCRLTFHRNAMPAYVYRSLTIIIITENHARTHENDGKNP